MKFGEKYNFLMKNTLLFAIANFSNKLIVFLLLPFYTAFLSTEEYAIIDLISITQQLVFPIITLDITEAMVRFGMEKKNDKASIFNISIIVTTVGNLILAVCCGVSIAVMGENVCYIVYFFLVSLVVSVNTLLSSFLRTIDKVHVITIASIINTLVVTVLNIILIAKLKKGIEGYYIAFIVGNVVAIAIMVSAIEKKYRKAFNKGEIKEYIAPMMKYALPLIPNALFWWVNSSLDRYFLTVLGTLSYVGMYAAANKIPSVLSILTSIFQQAWGLSIFKENESKTKQLFFDKVYSMYNFLVFAISLFLIFGAKFISALLLSKDFFCAWTWIPWLVFGFYSNALSSFIGTEFTAAKRTIGILLTSLISAGVNIILNVVLIPKYNGLGAAIATCISYFVLVELRVIIINSRFEIRIDNIKLLLSHCILLVAVIGATQTAFQWWIVTFLVSIFLFICIEKNVLLSVGSILMAVVRKKTWK